MILSETLIGQIVTVVVERPPFSHAPVWRGGLLVTAIHCGLLSAVGTGNFRAKGTRVFRMVTPRVVHSTTSTRLRVVEEGMVHSGRAVWSVLPECGPAAQVQHQPGRVFCNC